MVSNGVYVLGLMEWIRFPLWRFLTSGKETVNGRLNSLQFISGMKIKLKIKETFIRSTHSERQLPIPTTPQNQRKLASLFGNGTERPLSIFVPGPNLEGWVVVNTTLALSALNRLGFNSLGASLKSDVALQKSHSSWTSKMGVVVGVPTRGRT